MAVYYKTSGGTVYFTNEAKTDYRSGSANTTVAGQKTAVIELYEDKFVLPANARQMFDGAYNTEFNDMDKGDTSQCTNMISLFENCSRLQKVDLSNFDTSNVTDMGLMFSNCSSLKSINCGSFDTSNLVETELMFAGCSSVTFINVAGGDVSKLGRCSKMFYNCPNLTWIAAYEGTDWNKGQVQVSADMFEGSTKLPTYQTSSKVRDIGRANNTSTVSGFFGAPPHDVFQNTVFLKLGKTWWSEHEVWLKDSEGWEQVEVFF